MSQRKHVAADVTGCDSTHLDNLAWIMQHASRAAVDGGATVLGSVTHEFDPQGVTVVLLLAESHLSVHTWPECGECYLDVFTCGDVDPMPIAVQFVDDLGGEARFVVVGQESPVEGFTTER